jgi:filamentous hemagglutinin family protein
MKAAWQLSLSLLALSFFNPWAIAQTIIPANDGTATLVMPNGNTLNITGGMLSGDGRNLFHSFQEFGLSAQQIANFIANPQIQNILGRVTGGNPSIINGLIQVTGGSPNLFLMNPSGMVFGPNASLNVPASFAATTATGISFAGGQFNASGLNNYAALTGNPNSFLFQGVEPGAIVNAGNLAVNTGQGIALVGGTVINTGKIDAPGGEITLSAVPGSSLVRISQAGQVLSLEVPLPHDAQGNAIPFQATDLPALLTGSGLNTGLSVTPSGTVQLTATGTQIPTTPGTNIVSGQVTAANNNGVGGKIQATGTQVGLIKADINASGNNGGGTVLIGGDYQGKGMFPNAQNTYVSSDSVIKANGTNQGDGGKVVVWADGNTQFSGSIEAKGGVNGGKGGLAEVSGKQNLAFQGNVNLTAAQGSTGNLLLDPENITIVSGSGGANDSQLPNIPFAQNSGTNYTISESTLEALAGTTNVNLEAANNITVNSLSDGVLSFQPASTAGAGSIDGVLSFQPASTAGAGSIAFVANADNTGGGNFSMDTSNTLSAPGRNLTIRGDNITVGEINTGTGSDGLDGGAIALTATGNIQTGNLFSYTTANRGDVFSRGGDISLNAGGVIDTTTGKGIIIVQDATSQLQVPAIASGSSTGNGGNVSLVAGGNIKAPFIGTGSLSSGTAGNINVTSRNGAIDATQNLSWNGESQIFGGLVSASVYGNGGNVTLSAPGNIQTGVIATGNIGGPVRPGDVTITSQNGSINTAIGANINSVSTEFLASLGVPNQYLAEASQLQVGLGIFTFSKDTNGGNVTLNAQGNITTSNIITGSLNGNGGNITLISQNGSIDTSSGILFQGLNATTLQDLGASANLAKLGAYLSDNKIGGLITFSVYGSGGNINLTAPNGINTNYLVANSYTQNGGNISLNSSNGGITIGGLLANQINPLTFDSASDSLSLNDWNAIGTLFSQGSLTTAGANGGDITLTAKNDIQAVTINAQGGDQGTGGNVEIRTGTNLRVTGIFRDRNNTLSSISTAGGKSGGNITIQTGNVPFIVGNAGANGTAGAITTGNSTISGEDFSLTTQRGNINLILQDPPVTIPTFPPSAGLNAVLQTQSPKGRAARSLNSQSLGIKTILEAQKILESIAEKTGKKPALIYVQFVPPKATKNIFDDQQFNQRELELTSEYKAVLTPKLTNGQPTLTIPPLSNYSLELILVTQGQEPHRIVVSGVNRGEIVRKVLQFRLQIAGDSKNGSLKLAEKEDYLKNASQLYQWLIAPIEAELQAQKIDSLLFFLPDGLRTLPLAALYDEAKEEFAVQKSFSIGTAPSLNLVDYRYRNLNNAPVLAFGATDFPGQDENSLPGVGIELPLIQSVKGGEYFLNQDFNLQNLELQRRQNPLPIVHLATHADFVAPDLQQSYIQLYNQKLNIPSWEKLDLNLPVTDLLVISACNSAVGNSAVELGFGGLAVQAGVKTAVASLWSIGDIGTVGLMDGFYRNLKATSTKAEALQLAQIAMLKGEYRWSNKQLITPTGTIDFSMLENLPTSLDLQHPYYWSSFMMIGSPW